MKYLNIIMISLWAFGIYSCTTRIRNSSDVILENDEMRLIIAPDGTAKSLLHKPTAEECLMQNTHMPAFSIELDINYSPYDDIYKTNVLPVGRREFAADSVFLKDEKLIARFDIVDIDIVINADIKSQYIHFTIEDIVFNMNKSLQQPYRKFTIPKVDKVWFLCLPIRNRSNFGKMLNVIWDDQIAVNILATDPYTRIDSDKGAGYRILKAGSIDRVRLKGTGACLIVTYTEQILDIVSRIEENFELPHGG